MSTVLSGHMFFERQPRQDWFRILTELDRAGLNNERVAIILGVSKNTVAGWKKGAEPRHFLGVSLLGLYERHCEVRQTEPDIAYNSRT